MNLKHKIIWTTVIAVVIVAVFATAISMARKKSKLEEGFDTVQTEEVQERELEDIITIDETQTDESEPIITTEEVEVEETTESAYVGAAWDDEDYVAALEESESASKSAVFQYSPTGEQAKTPISVLHGYFSGVEGNGALATIEAFTNEFIVLDDWFDGMVYKVLFRAEDKVYLCIASEDSMVYRILDKTGDYKSLPSKPFKSAAERVGDAGLMIAMEEVENIKPLAVMTVTPDTSVPLKPLSTVGRCYGTEDGYKMLNAIEAFNPEADIYYDAYEGALYTAYFDVGGKSYQCISDEALTVFYIIEGGYF